MTREEAIIYLKRADVTVGREPKTKMAEALEMAIKALEQEPCEDCISRQEAIDAIEKTKSAITTDGEIYVAKINAEMNIQQLPPVTSVEGQKPCEYKYVKEVNLVKFDTPYADTISRQAAIDAMREETCMSCWDAKDILKHLPPASTENTGRQIKHDIGLGKWITVDKGLIVTSYKCSECGRTVRDDTGYDVTKDYPYCHCGAKMQEVEE